MRLFPGVLSLFIVTAALAGWSTHGPEGGRIAAVEAAPSDPNVIWAGGPAGVFRSADGGATWANAGAAIVDVDSIAVHPANPNAAWVVTGAWPNARVWATVDGGATWTDATGNLPLIRPGSIAVDPRHPGTLYVSSHCGPIGFASIGSLPVAPQFHETAGVFQSTDGGATWTRVMAGLPAFGQCAEEFALDPFSPWRLFSTGPFSDVAGYMESYDAGRSWERADGPRPGRAVVFDARFPFTHYGISAELGPQFLVSQDGGFTWTTVTTNLGLDYFRVPTSLSMDPERSRIFLGTTTGLYRSGNGGSVWAPTALQDINVTSLDFGGTPRALYAGTADGFFEVANRGLGAARPIELHAASANVAGLAVDPGNPNIVYAGTRTPISVGVLKSRVFRSSDGGASWQRLAGDDDTPKADIITVDAGGEVYAATSNFIGSLYRRGRDDAQWTVTAMPTIYDMAADPKTAGTAFVAVGGWVRRTRDGGATWVDVANTVTRPYLAIDPSDSRWVYAAEAGQLQRSGDGGDTWLTLQRYPAPGTFGPLVVAPSNGSVLYRVGVNSQPERSADRGATWSVIALPAGSAIQAIAVDPRNENAVWAGAGANIFRSSDGGKTWTAVAPPFAVPGNVTRLLFDPSGRVLHVTFPEHGVWELTTE